VNAGARTEAGRRLVASGLSFRSGRWLRDSPELVVQIEAEAVAQRNAELAAKVRALPHEEGSQLRRDVLRLIEAES